jgi:DNA-binding transcriptional regulator YhcF (GntR family)
MRFWLSKSSEVPLRQQLVIQVRLGIASGDLKVRQKLPSTRELARRFHIHSNTVSAAYRELARQGWVDFKQGSGVFVRGRNMHRDLNGHDQLDQLITNFLRSAREHRHSLLEIQSRLRHWLGLQPPDHFLFIEPDEELRRIVVAEIEVATKARVIGVGLDDCARDDLLIGAAPVSLYGQTEKVRAVLRADTDLITIRSRSVPESLSGEKQPPPDALIAVISRWPEFLRWANMILVAAGLNPDALSFRDARESGWQKGLRATSLVITDSLVARELPAGLKTRVFRIVSDSSLEDLRAFVEQFFTGH